MTTLARRGAAPPPTSGGDARAAQPGIGAGPLLMLLLSISGMAVGLAIDCAAVPPGVIASLCLGGAGDLAATVAVHWEVLPATHVATVAGALVAAAMGEAAAAGGGWPRLAAGRIAAIAASIAAMLAGMAIGASLAPDLLAGLGVVPGFTALVTGMVAGMALAMALSAPLLVRR